MSDQSLSDRACRLVLASSSPSRRAVLENAGIRFEVAIPEFDEEWDPADDPAWTVLSLARGKGLAVLPGREDAYVLGCDSLFVFEGQLLGKPRTEEEVERRWRLISGRSGVLYTGHALAHEEYVLEEVVATTVHFGHPTDSELAAYVASRESIGVAGAFTLEGRSAGFIDRIDGDPANVLGLSVAALRRLLAAYGVEISEVWR
jgi:septum formation protein